MGAWRMLRGCGADAYRARAPIALTSYIDMPAPLAPSLRPTSPLAGHSLRLHPPAPAPKGFSLAKIRKYMLCFACRKAPTTHERKKMRTTSNTIEILANAAKSALDLGNFPLGISDVQCAFDCFVQEHAKSQSLLSRKISEPAHIEAIRLDLANLGFPL